jgi:hypothetical protein
MASVLESEVIMRSAFFGILICLALALPAFGVAGHYTVATEEVVAITLLPNVVDTVVYPVPYYSTRRGFSIVPESVTGFTSGVKLWVKQRPLTITSAMRLAAGTPDQFMPILSSTGSTDTLAVTSATKGSYYLFDTDSLTKQSPVYMGFLFGADDTLSIRFRMPQGEPK